MAPSNYKINKKKNEKTLGLLLDIFFYSKDMIKL
jgi:hypothetical protein